MKKPLKVSLLKYRMRKVTALKPSEGNARKHSAAQIKQIAESIKRFGFPNPILATHPGEIIAGHGRLEAAKLLELEEVPTLTAPEGWSADELRAYMLTDNQLALTSEWDDEALKREVQALVDSDFDISVLGFDDIDLMRLIRRAGLSDEDVEEVPPTPEQPVSRPGSVWLLGDHRVMCGDATDPADRKRALGPYGAADLVFTSPPYAQQRLYEGREIDDWQGLMRGAFSEIELAPAGQLLVNLGMIYRDGEWFAYWTPWIDAMREAGWKAFGWYVWDQGAGLPGRSNGRLAPSFEFIFHFTKTRPMEVRKTTVSKSFGGFSSGATRGKDGSVKKRPASKYLPRRTADSVIRVERRNRGWTGHSPGNHPATFPVQLVEQVMLAFSQPGSVVFDPFGGSGTSIIAAERVGRRGVSMDLSPGFTDVTVVRWQDATGETATDEDGRPFAKKRAARKAAARGVSGKQVQAGAVAK